MLSPSTAGWRAYHGLPAGRRKRRGFGVVLRIGRRGGRGLLGARGGCVGSGAGRAGGRGGARDLPPAGGRPKKPGGLLLPAPRSPPLLPFPVELGDVALVPREQLAAVADHRPRL